MHRFLMTSVVLVALVALGVASTLAASSVARGGGEFASEEAFAFFAQKKDKKTSGWFWYFAAGANPYPIEGRVKCLLVKGDKAVMAGTLTVPATFSSDPSTTMRTFVLVAEDLGAGENTPTDSAGISFLDGATPPSCSRMINNSGSPMAAGDLTVS